MLDVPKRVLPALLLLLSASVAVHAAFLTGDFNKDCSVNLADLRMLADKWLTSAPLCVEQGLVGHWKLDESGGLTAADSSPNALDAGLNGSPFWRPGTGHIGGAIELDGIDDSVQVVGYKGIAGDGPRTCSAWIRTTHTDVEIMSWGDNDTPGARWHFGISGKGFLCLDVNDGYAIGSTYVNDNLWHHVAVASYQEDANSVDLFVDGILDTIGESKGHLISTAEDADVRFGAPAATGGYFKGTIDDVRIYDRALSMEEVWALARTYTTDITCVDIVDGDGTNLRDFALMASNWLRDVSAVIINEFMADNDKTLATVVKIGDTDETEVVYPAWIELYNQSGFEVDLSGWYLTDDEFDLAKWSFPEGTTIEPGEYLIVFASGKGQADNPDNYPYVDELGYLHTNFNLRNDGEYLALVEGVTDEPETVRVAHHYYSYLFDANPIQFGYPPQDGDISYGMFYNEQRYFGAPTPGGRNSSSFIGYVGDTTFSHDRGFYDGKFDLTITSSTKGATIRYTTDGSEPSEDDNGITYEGPITIDKTTTLRAMAYKPGWVATNVDTQTYIFIDDVLLQSPNGEQPNESWPNEEVRVNGQNMAYGMDPEVVNDPEYAGLMDDALLALPAISIVTDTANLFDPQKGIYVNAQKHGVEWERPASVELLNPDGSKGFHINAGLRIRGGYSRSGGNPKHAFRLFFKGQYGSPKLEFPLFGGEGVDSFDKMDLRTAQNYSWSFEYDRRNTMCREVFSRDMQRDMGQPYTRSRYYHLYLNGQYWGLFQTQERSEARYAVSYFGGDVEDYDVVKVNAGPYTVEATDGDLEAYKKLFEAFNEGFSNNEVYYRIQGLNPDGTGNPEYPKLLDVDNIIDYMISTYFVGDFDSPISNFVGGWGVSKWPNNFYGIYNRLNPDGFKFFRHDAEHSLFLNRGWDRTGPYMSGPGEWLFLRFNPQQLHERLIWNAEYRRLFADRVQDMFFNNGLLTVERARANFLERAEQIETAIIAESARWGDSKNRQDEAMTKADWLEEIDEVANVYFPERTDGVLDQFRRQQWYPPIPAPSFLVNDSYRHGGHISSEDMISMTSPGRMIFYTLDGTDPAVSENQTRVVLDTIVSENAPKRVHVPVGPDDGFANAPVPDVGHWRFDDDYDDASGKDNHGYPYGDMVVRDAFVENRYDEPDKALYFDGFDDFVRIPPPWDPEFFDITEDITLACWVKYANHKDRAGLLTRGEFSWDLSLADEGDEGKISFHLEGVGTLVSEQTCDDDQWHHIAAVRNGETMTLYIDGEQDSTLAVDPNSTIAIGTSLVFIGSNYELWWDEENGWPLPVDERVSYEGVMDDVRIYSYALTPEEVKRLERDGEFWPRLRYDDLEWTAGNDGVGFCESEDHIFQKHIGIDVEEEMHNENSTCCIRIPFTILDAERIVNMALRIRYDDGFVAYLNGEEVARGNLEGEPEWNSVAMEEVVDTDANQLAEFDLSDHLDLLRTGDNVLGILGINVSKSDSDFLISAELVTGENVPLSENAVRYTEPFTLDKSTEIKARTLDESGELSAVNTAIYAVGPVAENLRITEIMYHPPEEWGADPNCEYIELRNIGDDAINLNLVSFTDGIHFTFGDKELDAGAHVLLVRKRSAFGELYPDSNDLVAGVYTGSLENAGERIRLADAFGRTIHQFKYDDDWYKITDGDGFSLTVRNSVNEELALLNEGLVAYWQFDDRSSATVDDSIANGHDGTIFGDALYRPLRGKVDGAMLLDGEDDYVEFADFKGVSGGRDRTCSAWIRTLDADGEIIAWGDSSSGGKWVFGIDDNGCLQVEAGSGRIAGVTVVNDGRWHHVAAVLDGGATDDILLYIDGEPDQIGDISSQSISTGDSADVTIGVFGDSENFFAGLIDEVRIYDTALDAKLIRTLSNLHNVLDEKKYWRPSAYVLGSGGYDDPVYGEAGYVPEPGEVTINELLTHSDATGLDWIELHNTTDHVIDIGGWFISDNSDNFEKFQIPAGTTILPGGYRVFDEDDFNAPDAETGFALSENGETVYVRSAKDAEGNFTGFYDSEEFGASDRDISFGRYYKESTDTYNFVAMESQTPGEDNGLPLVGPVVINKIMYNPLPGGTWDHNEYEYIEIVNTSVTAAARLYEYDNKDKRYVPWRFTDGIDYEFPPFTTLQPGESILVVKNRQAFEERYGDLGVSVFGPWDGRLDNAGEKLTLSKPADGVHGEYYYIRVDRVVYDNSLPWPRPAAGFGKVLIRKNTGEYGNDVVNWEAGDDYPRQ